ncbi:prostaglandin D2 receptor [Bactrocera dorsalis]|uniref:Prostaglandin D2 receptor n=1 Tax=Bactrocera dorsalis TaxID=27457 RepID=A0A6I9VGI9_BACDO|nr:prostaglandin D2 receptor [Bactrocera dorsalis]XP_029407748.2 prostaglandin D2 receptor [Bactrocera dorsalis]XP_029407749.2 prostaglandin D2 receptor [Bactrocera dorsalis]XP_029407750.2 prostaglandin D2 receptor [Bactrocera dorsalis]XP_049313569.1 prostaglandin D2 receptor [Bactrocera dorsalis]XP_049313570.1 prostaglandin D2 receptor [Bactrocera dorsalis]
MANTSVLSLISLDSEAVTTADDFAWNVSSTAAPSIVAQPLALYHNRRRFLFSGIVLLLGVIGNLLALIILARKKATKNSKYTLMLRCLASNNLIGLLGMLTTMLLKIYVPEEEFKAYVRWDCTLKVLCRFFGLSSGCIAAVMAIERWMALARPFIYHKHITYELVRKTINSLVLIAVVITFLPFIGFGAYIDESDPENPKCLRYRDAEGFWNKTYSVLFMLFGSLLCVVIVACNLFVTRVLCFIGRTRTTKRHMHYDMVNREKGSVSRIEGEPSSGSSLYHHSNSVTMTADASPDEIKFAKLMAYLSISFVICWMPQMIAIPMAILPNRVPKAHPFFILADVLMALHFTSDPYIYVLSRTKHSYILGCFKRCRCELRRSHSDQSRLRTTIEQNTSDCGLN